MEEMDPSSILSIIHTVTIGTMLVFNSGDNGHGLKNVKCKQAISISVFMNDTIFYFYWVMVNEVYLRLLKNVTCKQTLKTERTVLVLTVISYVRALAAAAWVALWLQPALFALTERVLSVHASTAACSAPLTWWPSLISFLTQPAVREIIMADLHCRILILIRTVSFIVICKAFQTARSQIPILTAQYRNGIGIGIRIRECT